MIKFIVFLAVFGIIAVIGYGHIHQCEGVAINIQCAEAQIDRLVAWTIGGMAAVALLTSWMVVSGLTRGKFL